MKKPLILIGGGGHCRACIDVIEQEGVYEIVGILDKLEMVGKEVLGYKVIGTDEDIERLCLSGNAFLITVGQVGDATIRVRIYDQLQALKAELATVISPRAYVSCYASIGKGSIVMHDALVNAAVKIGMNCIINTKALVEHDVCVEDHCHVATAAVVNGGALLRHGTFFGSGAVSKECVRTSTQDFIKAGSIFKG